MGGEVQTDEDFKQTFDAVDTNQDGLISFEDFENFMLN